MNNRNKRKSIKYSTKLIGVTRDCCNSSFGKNLGIVIHNTYDEVIYNMQCKEVDDGRMVISQIATFNDNKNQLFSLKIANALKKSGVDFTLKLAGKETENGYLSKLENYIFENGLDDVVELIDGSSGVYEVYKASTFVLIPSKAEGASIVAVEAQACGIHVFSSSSVPHEMNVGGMSFIDLKDSPEKWAEEIISKYKEVGSKRFAFDMKPFSSESFKNNIVKIYNN